MRVMGDTMLVFGGIYGNAQAFFAMREAEKQIVPADMLCTGDLSAYCADGAAICEIMRRELGAAIIVRGNCERAIADDAADCGCGYAAGSTCDTLSFSWYAHAKNSISVTDKTWMGALPEHQIIRFGGRTIAVVHADVDTDNRFIFASTSFVQKQKSLAALKVDGIIAGHSGIPFTDYVGDNIWHNSGALGMPANDGTSRVWYSRWTATATGIHIAHRALSYDFVGAQTAMIRAGLPSAYRRSLKTGIWPSDSILPAAERQQQGVPIQPKSHFWSHTSCTDEFVRA